MDNKKLLSICICTLKEREDKFNKLLKELKRQIGMSRNPEYFEILFDAGERGVISIGAKREKMKRIATGKYFVGLDDDDDISSNYIYLLEEGMWHNVDIITFGQDFYQDGRFVAATYFNRFLNKENAESKAWGFNFNHTRKFYWAGSAYHLMAVRRELALKVPFIDANFNEDHLYSEGLKPLLQSEFHIPHVLYKVNNVTKDH